MQTAKVAIFDHPQVKKWQKHVHLEPAVAADGKLTFRRSPLWQRMAN
jgi:hypothetical protein